MKDRHTRARILFTDMRDSIRCISDLFDRAAIVLACGERMTTLYKHRLEDQAPDWGVDLTPHPSRAASVADARALLEGLAEGLDAVNRMPPETWRSDPHLPRHAFTTTYAYLTALPSLTVIDGGSQ